MTSLEDVEAEIAKARAATADALEEWRDSIEDAGADDADRLFEQAAVIAETRASVRRMVEKREQGARRDRHVYAESARGITARGRTRPRVSEGPPGRLLCGEVRVWPHFLPRAPWLGGGGSRPKRTFPDPAMAAAICTAWKKESGPVTLPKHRAAQCAAAAAKARVAL
jgi:hypothetical protein